MITILLAIVAFAGAAVLGLVAARGVCDTIAESPPVRYSNESDSAGSTQPLPVVVTTSRFARWKPPARSRSLTARAARDSASEADASPA